MARDNDTLAGLYKDVLSELGEDPTREGLEGTPMRVAKAMSFLTSGYTQSLDAIVNGAIFTSDIDQMVLVRDIEFYSLCEHHMLPFVGHAHVAYIPDGKVLGLSKIARIVEMFARRLQIQEELTRQVAEAVQQVTGALGVAVTLEASHMCMQMRGVQKQNASMTTSVMLGVFMEDAPCRTEYLQLIRG
jgi:GTP cyclohydrolase I